MNVLKWVIGVPVVLFAAMFLLGAVLKLSDSQPTGRQNSDYAVSQCWSSYERKSLSPMDKRQIATFCEGLEQRAKDAK